jgi:pimeloyl-ACP methyl ester carboxylesterase
MASSGSGSGGGGRRAARHPPTLLSRLVDWFKGRATWVLAQGLGAALAAPLGLKLLVQLVTSPRRTLWRQDRSALVIPDPLPGLTHEWIETAPGIKLHAARTSKGRSKPLMLLVHGFPEAWFSWRAQMAAFRDEFEVVAIDMRGYNESSAPKGRHHYRLSELGADVQAVARHLLQETGQQQLVLVGHDWGANACWAAAHAAPELFSKLAILCVPHPRCFLRNLDWDQFKRSWYILAFQMPWLPEAALSASDYEMLAASFTASPMGLRNQANISAQDVERYKQAFQRCGGTPIVDYYRALVDGLALGTMEERLPPGKCTVPTLLVWADKDIALGPQLLRGTERYVETLRVEVLRGCSHWAQQDQPEKVNALLREHLGLPPKHT